MADIHDPEPYYEQGPMTERILQLRDQFEGDLTTDRDTIRRAADLARWVHLHPLKAAQVLIAVL